MLMPFRLVDPAPGHRTHRSVRSRLSTNAPGCGISHPQQHLNVRCLQVLHVVVVTECSDLLHVVVTAVLRVDRETPSYESLEALRRWLQA